MKPSDTADMNLVKLVEEFRSEAECRHFLEGLRWPRGIRCPRCGGKTISRIAERDQFDCDSCRYQFSVMAGTILNDTHLPLWKWFMAVYLTCESKKGVSANQLKRTLDMNYRTAWYLSHRIRQAMSEAANATPLKGRVEVDETYIGGKPRYMGKQRGWETRPKTVVLGAIARNGEVRLRVERHRLNRKALHRFIRENVDDTATAIYTDSMPAYGDLSDADTKHEKVDHSAKEWVRGDVHTNTVESVRSLFKRSIVGSYHRLSVKHMDSYLDEFEWRHNNRRNAFLFRDTMLALLRAEKMPYKELIDRPA